MYPKGNLLIPASHGHLEAILREPSGKARGLGLVCHPHPLGGGTMHNKVVYRAFAALLDAGLTSLRFNFRGVGLSTGEHDGGNGEKQDALDALDYLSANFPGSEVTFAGFSFGSWVGSRALMNDERVARFISVGTPVGKYDFSDLKNLRKPVLFVSGDRDEFAKLENLRSLVAEVSENTDATLIVFENCGHFFEKHLSQLKDAIYDWTLEKLTEARA